MVLSERCAMVSNYSWIDVVAWVSLFFYFICFIPQIIENFRIKSTRGLSRISLVAYFVGYLAMLYYIFLLDLLLPYKVVVPLEFACMAVIALQRFHYEGIFTDKMFFACITSSVAVAIFIFPLVWVCPLALGAVCGWISLAGFLIHPVPQIIKVYHEKSVEGFSFGFVTLLAIAVTCELMVALVRGLPIQTVFMALKGLFFYVIFCWQFWRYSKRNKPSMTIVEKVFEPCLHAKEGVDENSMNFPVCRLCEEEHS